MKDGASKSGGIYCFKADGTFNYKLPGIDFNGIWRAIDAKTLKFKLDDYETECTLEFVSKTEAVLVEPRREPPSRMIV